MNEWMDACTHALMRLIGQVYCAGMYKFLHACDESFFQDASMLAKQFLQDPRLVFDRVIHV